MRVGYFTDTSELPALGCVVQPFDTLRNWKGSLRPPGSTVAPPRGIAPPSPVSGPGNLPRSEYFATTADAQYRFHSRAGVATNPVHGRINQ